MKKQKMAAAVPQKQPAPAVAPQTKTDPLRAVLRNLQPKQRQGIHATLLTRIRKQLAAMSDYDAHDHNVQAVARFMWLLEGNRGDDSPADDFIIGLVADHCEGGLTPDHTAHELERFRELFDTMVDSTGLFNDRYPKLVKAAPAA